MPPARKRTTQAPAAEAAPVETAPVAAPAPVVAAPAVVVAAAAPVAEPQAKPEKKTPKPPKTDRLGFLVATARSSAHIKRALAKPVVDAQVRAITARLETITDTEERKAVKEQLDEEQKKITRVSNDMPVAMTAVVEAVITELLVHGIEDATRGGAKSNVDVRNLHAGEPLPLAPLYALCPTWRNYSEQREDVERAAIAERSKQQRELKAARQAAIDAGNPPPAAAPAATTGGDEDDDEHDDETNTTFRAYVSKVISHLRLTLTQNRNVRMGVRVVPVLSDLVTEMIHSLTRSTEIAAREIHNVRTMTVNDFTHTLQIIFNHYHQSVAYDAVGPSDHCSYSSPVLAPLLETLKQKVAKHAEFTEQDRKAQQDRKKAADAAAATDATATAATTTA